MIREQTENYTLHRDGSRAYLTLRSLDSFDGLRHLFTTRQGGVSDGCCSSWNFGAHELDTAENIRKNYEILAETLGSKPERMVRTAQTHTRNIRIVTEEDCGKGITRERDYDDVDGLLTNQRNIPIITGHADCNAVFFYDPVCRVIGIAHSGWRGTLAGISVEMVRTMQSVYGCCPEDIIAGLGPALCQNCFEVDEDVARVFCSENPANEIFMDRRGHKWHIDLKGMIRRDLLACGILPAHYSDMNLCTKCSKDIFFSHRGHFGKRGIMAAAMMLE